MGSVTSVLAVLLTTATQISTDQWVFKGPKSKPQLVNGYKVKGRWGNPSRPQSWTESGILTIQLAKHPNSAQTTRGTGPTVRLTTHKHYSLDSVCLHERRYHTSE